MGVADRPDPTGIRRALESALRLEPEAYQCPRCRQRGQTWEGDPPRCGFDRIGNFKEDNWNCATLNALRVLAEPMKFWCDDQSIGIITSLNAGMGVLCWYKDHGRTDRFAFQNLEPATLEFAEELLKGDELP